MVNLELLSQPSVLQLARAGDFQAIAYWLNTYLVPQEIYARVAVDRPGWLLVLVEFCQPPDRDRLNRFVCHRLCRLNSDVIQGVRIVARPLGSPNTWWDRSIRLATTPRRSARPSRPARPTRRLRSPHPSHRAVQVQPATPARSLPRSTHKRRRSPAALALAHRSAVTPVLTESMQALTESARALTAALVDSTRQLSPSQVAMLGKAAAAVFLVSFGVVVTSRSLPLWGDPSDRPMTVQTSSGKVSVIQANAIADPTDPTVTLTFSSDPTVNLTATRARDQSLDQATFPDGIANAATSWPVRESNDPLGAGSLGAGSLGADSLSKSDILMTNLDQPVSDLQALLGATLNSTASTETTRLKRSPSTDSITVVSLSGEPLVQDGSAGLVKTLEAVEKAGMYSVGAGRNRHEARRPEIIDVRGKRIAYLAYADSDAHAAKGWQAGTNPALKAQVVEDIQAIRDQVDWVVVNYRWSQDLASFPAEWQMTVARHAIDQGADLVVGYHPNVLQGAEIYKGRAIAYSLGDFVLQDSGKTVNTAAMNPASGSSKPIAAPAKTQYDTAMLKVSIKDDQMKLEFLPVQVKDAQPTIAQGQKQTEILRYLGQASSLFEIPLRSPAVLNRLDRPSAPSAADPRAADPRAAPPAAPNAVPKTAPPAFPPAADDNEPQSAPDQRLSPEDGSDSFINYPQPSKPTPKSAPTPANANDQKPSPALFDSPQTSLPTLTPEHNPEHNVTQPSAASPLHSQSQIKPPLAALPAHLLSSGSAPTPQPPATPALAGSMPQSATGGASHH